MKTKSFISKILCCLLIMLSFIFSLAACKNVEFKVNFVVDGAVYATVDTNGDEVIKMPKNPTKEDYTFDGWYWDNGTWQQPFTANSLLDAPLSSDMSVYAKFVSNEVPPTESFIVNGLKNMPNITGVEAVTEYNDPNGQLGKDGGYVACVYFSVDVIEQSRISGITLVDKGTSAGGCVEVYANSNDAEKRNTYLAAFDGSILSAGSHTVVGTCVVRTADSLTVSQQNILEGNITKLLKGSTENYVSLDTYLTQVAKQLAEEKSLSEYETATELITLGYPVKKAEQIAKDCGANWNNIAKIKAEGYADYYATVSPIMINELLADHEFTEAQIEYALKNATIDWKLYAVAHAEEFVGLNEKRYYITPLDVKVYLNNDKGYSVEDSEYAVEHSDINWNAKALEYIDAIEKDGILGPKADYILALTDMDFTQSQAEYAVQNCDNNWNYHALLCVKHYVEDLCITPPNHSECIAKLKEWGFSDSEANYAVANYDGLIYPDKLDYVITLNPDGGTLSTTSLNVKFGKTYSLPTPTKTGYTFEGWYNGLQYVTSGTWYTTYDITLKAIWSKTKYAITYNLDGGVNNASNPKEYTIDDSVTLYAPTKEGHTFIGWLATGQSTSVYSPTIEVGSTGNKTFTAVWSPNTYTITFDANGGTYNKTTETVTFGQYYKPTSATRTGYTFNNWHYDTGNGYYEEYCNDYYGIAHNITLQAWWTANNYTITYDANGGTISSTTQSVKYDSTYTLRTPTRTGYTFLGWYNGENKVDGGIWKLTSGLSLKAEWQVKTYNVTFNANEGNCSTTSLTATFDEYLTLPTPTRTGYTFSGWYSGNTKYSSGTWKTDGNVSLTAKWTARTDIPYVVNHYQENIYDSGYTLYTTQNLTGTADATIQPTTNSYTGFTSPSKQTVTVNPDGSRVVNYYYTRNSYSITFVTNGGNSISKITQKYQTSLNVPDAVREDYTFGGWFTNATLTSSYSKPTTMPATSKTIYAYWAEENKPGDFTYSGSSAITVSAYKGSSTTMWIPAYIGGKPVTTIPESVFASKTSITKVVVPDTVETIGSGAFKGCTSLVDITLPFVGNSEFAENNYQQVFGWIFGYNDTSNSTIADNYTTSSSNGTAQALEQWSYSSMRMVYYYIPKSISNVTITTQTAIPNNAFRNCDLIETINLPDNTISLGSAVFYNCKSVSAYNESAGISSLPESITSIPDYAFANNTALSEIFLPTNVKSIGAYAFSGCTALIGVKTKSPVVALKTIGAYAFNGCTSLCHYFNGGENEINVPINTTSIGTYAFANNTSITKIVVPNTVSKIGSSAFRGCSALVDISLPFVGNNEGAENNYQQVFGWIFGYNDTSNSTIADNYSTNSSNGTAQALEQWSYSSMRMVYYYIPKSVRNVTITKQTAIPNNAFRNCDLIETIKIPSNTVSIGNYAFYNCKAVTSYNGNEHGVSILPATLVNISDYAFNNNKALLKVVFSPALESIGSYAFNGCTALTEATAASNITTLTTIGSYAFNGCTSLSYYFLGEENELNIPTNTVSIGTHAFANNVAITKVVVPDTVTLIGVAAFRGCSSLEDITLPFVGNSEGAEKNYQQVFGWIFGYNDVSNSTIMDSYSTNSSNGTAQALEQWSYSSMRMVYYYIPKSVRNVTITKQTAIPNNAFRNCDLIETVTLPSNVVSVGDYAFYNTKKLTTTNISNTATVGKDAFVGSGILEGKTGVVYIGSVLYKYNGTMPSGYTVKVKDGTTAIQANAFSGCSGLTTLILPEGLKSIGTNAFKNCTSLKEVVIPSSIESIGSSAFYGCSVLTKITIPFIGTSKTSTSSFSSIFSTVPTSLTTVVVTGDVDIPANAFKNCTKLTTITFTGAIGEIGTNAFYGCSALTTLTLPNTVTSLGNYAFYSCSKLATVELANMSELTAIGSYAFQNCTSLTSIVVPETVTTIGDYTFSGCTKLATASLSSKTTAIGNYAFNGCTALTTFTMNSSVLETIGAYAFQNCSSLATIYVPITVAAIGEYAFNGCSALTIYCGAASQPDDWDYNWNPSNCTVAWGK